MSLRVAGSRVSTGTPVQNADGRRSRPSPSPCSSAGALVRISTVAPCMCTDGCSAVTVEARPAPASMPARLAMSRRISSSVARRRGATVVACTTRSSRSRARSGSERPSVSLCSQLSASAAVGLPWLRSSANAIAASSPCAGESTKRTLARSSEVRCSRVRGCPPTGRPA
ncbi:hypothetical protein ACQPYE_19080 [Actinosynnema sp. CA-299493]